MQRIATDLRDQVESLLESLASVTSERTQSCHEAAELHQRIAGLETTIERQNLEVSHLHTAWLALRNDAAQTPDLVLALQQRLAKIIVLPPAMTIPQILVEANQFLDWLVSDVTPRTDSTQTDAGHQARKDSPLLPRRPYLPDPVLVPPPGHIPSNRQPATFLALNVAGTFFPNN